MSAFLDALGNQISNQFLGGQDSPNQRSLSGKLNGQDNNFAKLGDFAREIDQSAQRRYLEEGYLANGFDSTSAKLFQLSMQQPEATVIVRKKMYTSLANNYAPELMSEEERLTYLAMDRLFSNKSKQISAYEKLCKIQSATQKTGEVDEQILPLIVGFSDLVSTFGGNPDALGSFSDKARKIKAVINYSSPNFYTTWIEDVVTPRSVRFGSGTGAIEFTNFTNVSTSCSIKDGPQSASVNFDDPYGLMTITINDIEKAISDVVNVNNYSNSQAGFNASLSFNDNGIVNGKPGFNSSIGTGKDVYDGLIEKKMAELNSMRVARGASSISFNINPNTIYGKKLIAIMDYVGQEIPFEATSPGLSFGRNTVKIPPEYLYGGEVFGSNGLSSSSSRGPLGKAVPGGSWLLNSELSLFNDIVNAIYSKMALEGDTQRQYDFINGNNEMINYVRRKMMFYFAGKNIIQPMDTVNVWISSKFKYDTKIMSGIKNAFTGFGLLQNFSNQLNNLKSSWNALFNSGESFDLQMEKSLFLGTDSVSDFEWSMFRKNFSSEKEGCHVFAGIVKTATSSFSDGFHNVTVTIADNTEYLNQSYINFKPGTNTSANAFYDPLTPYKTKFDSVYSLYTMGTKLAPLDENLKILNGSLTLRSQAGKSSGRLLSGELPSEVEYTEIESGSRTGKKTIFAPDGLVYKWKEGVGTMSNSGSSSQILSEDNVGLQSAAAEVLANQDVMNAISLMVTGTPYNYYTFYKSGVETSALKTDQTKQQLTASRLSQFIESVNRNNIVWGNFIPFKNLTLNGTDAVAMLSKRFSNISTAQEKLSSLYKKSEELRTAILQSSFSLDSKDGKNYNIEINVERNAKILEDISTTMQKAEMSLVDEVYNNSNVSIVGNDISEDYDYYINNAPGKNQSGASYDNYQLRREMSKKLNFLTRRLSWQVRANIDKNYFIVDDNYDKNYDLRAFEAEIAGQTIQIWNNQYTPVLDQVKRASKILGLEFYADTQGHIRVRAPRFNRIPSSIFYKMIFDKYNKKSIQMFPSFLNDIFGNQIRGLYNKLTSIEDEIRFFCALLQVGNNLSDDENAIKYIRGIDRGGSNQKSSFDFLSNPSDGEIKNVGRVYSNNFSLFPENLTDNDFSVAKKIKEKVENQLNLNTTFDLAYRVKNARKKIEDLLKNNSNLQDNNPLQDDNIVSVITTLTSRIFQKTGKTIKAEDYIKSVGKEEDNYIILGQVIFPKIPETNTYEIDNQIANRLAERQKVIKQIYFATKNAYEFNSLTEGDTAAKLINPSFGSKNNSVPEAFDGLIEDESYDDYGPGSASRFIIKNSQITSYSINENSPQYTAVTVTGRQSRFLTRTQTGTTISSLPSNGTPLIQSSAVDYDMWKMYGFKFNADIDKPFLTNPETQTEPYAISLLAEQRKNIMQGRVSIVGNEYMQPGEVVYLEEKGMLFYVETVSHSFSVGGNFITTLSLSYGHYPGDYIPSQLDIAGKLLYAGRDRCDIQIIRGGETISGISVGAFVMMDSENIGNNFDLNNQVGNTNSATLVSLAKEFRKQLLANKSNKSLTTQLRIHIYENKTKGYKNKTQDFANLIKDILTGKSAIKVQDPEFTNFESTDIVVDNVIDFSSESNRYNISSSASGAAGQLIEKLNSRDSGEDTKGEDVTSTNSLSKTPTGKLELKEQYLCSYIVDCFIKTYPK